MASTQVDFFMRPERLAALLEEVLEGWGGTVVVQPSGDRPLRYVVVELAQLRGYVESRGVDVIELSLVGSPRDESDLEYGNRTPGNHVRIKLGRVDEKRRHIGYCVAIVDRPEKPALGLLRRLRTAILRISKRGVRTVLASGEVKILRHLSWTPDLRDWDLFSYQAVDDADAEEHPS